MITKTLQIAFKIPQGFDTVECNDPREGLEQIKDTKYDFVILDITMPGFNGIDIIAALEKEKILK